DHAVEGVAGAPVDLVAAGKTAALVSDVETLDLRATRRDLLAHSRVLELALESSPVLPLRFGIVFRDRESVVSELLVPRRAELASERSTPRWTTSLGAPRPGCASSTWGRCPFTASSPSIPDGTLHRTPLAAARTDPRDDLDRGATRGAGCARARRRAPDPQPLGRGRAPARARRAKRRRARADRGRTPRAAAAGGRARCRRLGGLMSQTD